MALVKRRSRARDHLLGISILLLKFAAASFVTLFALSLLTYLATSIRSPEEQALASLGNEATTEQIRAFIALHGLNSPVLARYVRWAGSALMGDFGYSDLTREPVITQLLPRLLNTMVLATSSLVLAAIVAIPIGIAMARHVYSGFDRALLTTSVIIASVPEFIIGVLLIYVFAVKLRFLPVDSSGVALKGLWNSPSSLALPVVTSAACIVPYLLRVCRAGMIDALSSMSVRSATLRGLSPIQLTYKYSLRIVALPLIGALAICAASLLGGSLIVENIFGYPGLGQLAVAALTSNDIPTVQACAVVLGAMIVIINFVADLFAIKFNPRLRTAQ